MRIPKLLLIVEIDDELTKIFSSKVRLNFRKVNEKMNPTSSV